MLRALFVFILGSIGAALLACVAAVVFIATNSSDLDHVDDADLRFDDVAVPDTENGFNMLSRALSEVPRASEAEEVRLLAHLEGSNWDAAWVSDELARQSPIIEAIESANAAPAFQIPPLDTENPEKTDWRLWRQLGRASALRALARSRTGDADGALSDALAVVTLGARMQEASGATLLSGMLGFQLKKLGLNALTQALAVLELDDARARETIASLEGFRTDAAAWRRIWGGEYSLWRRQVLSGWEDMRAEAFADANLPEGSTAGWLPETYLFQPNRTQQLLADLVRAHQSDASKPCRVAPPAPRRPEGRFQNLLMGFGPNGAGRILVWIALPEFERMGWQRCRSDAQLAAVQISLALRARELTRGSLPASLVELVPDFFQRVPRDPFDGEAFRYRADDRLLYSVGGNFEDEGGAGRGDPILEPSFPLSF